MFYKRFGVLALLSLLAALPTTACKSDSNSLQPDETAATSRSLTNVDDLRPLCKSNHRLPKAMRQDIAQLPCGAASDADTTLEWVRELDFFVLDEGRSDGFFGHFSGQIPEGFSLRKIALVGVDVSQPEVNDEAADQPDEETSPSPEESPSSEESFFFEKPPPEAAERMLRLRSDRDDQQTGASTHLSLTHPDRAALADFLATRADRDQRIGYRFQPTLTLDGELSVEGSYWRSFLIDTRRVVDGSHIEAVTIEPPVQDSPRMLIEFDAEGSNALAELSKHHVGKRIVGIDNENRIRVIFLVDRAMHGGRLRFAGPFAAADRPRPSVGNIIEVGAADHEPE